MASWFGSTAAGQQALSQSPLRPVGSSSQVKSGDLTNLLVSSGPLQKVLDQKLSVGDEVEYLSASQGKWIPAKVLVLNSNGTVDLDCKPEVPQQRIRRKSNSDKLQDLSVGMLVEYYSVSQGKWISAKILSVKSKGVFDLDCKPDVSLDRIRLRRSAGERVEYFSATQNTWIPAQIVSCNANGTYNLDCKPDVMPDKIRDANGMQEAKSEKSSEAGQKTLRQLASQDFSEEGEFKVGDKVEYYSSTHSRWIPAEVKARSQSGAYDLDCKADVRVDKIRRASTGSSFAVGETVEYFSASVGDWIAARVIKVNDGSFDLDCKPSVTADRIRRPSKKDNNGPDVDLSSSVSYKVGDRVEYFGATQQKWIPAKVLKVNVNGTFDLDCKMSVVGSKMRWPSSSGDSSPARRMMQKVGSAVGALAGVTSWLPGGGSNKGGELRLTPLAGLEKPVQLLAARRGAAGSWRLEVNKEGATLLEKLGNRRIAIASVCGGRRSGKSMLLDALQNPSKTPVSHESNNGIWMTACQAQGDDAGTVLVLLECQGFSGLEGDGSQDAHWMSFLALLSSVLILNVPSSDGLSDVSMATFAKACRFPDMIEERGNEANRPLLHCVLRDVEGSRLKDSRGRPIEADEFFEQKLNITATPSDTPEGHAARETRRALLHFFKQRRCTVLPPLGESTAFKTQASALRDSVVQNCLTNPKAVGGRSLTCFALVQLLRQLSTAANDGWILNLKAAWETVQHTTCGALSDELRECAAAFLRDLASGRSVLGGARLPLTDDELNTVLRDQRRTLKSRWEDQAVGDDHVRAEYWHELKQTLAREEGLVRTQNARLADKSGVEALREWQEWLDADAGEAQSSEQPEVICRRLATTLEKLPARPLARSGRAALQAAARHVIAARETVQEAARRHGDLQREAMALGERAAHQEGAARSELDLRISELARARQEAAECEQDNQETKSAIHQKILDLKECEASLRSALAELESIQVREREQITRHRAQVTTLDSIQTEIDQLRQAANKEDTQRLATERHAESSAETSAGELNHLREELSKAHAEAAAVEDQLARDKADHERALADVKAEHEDRIEQHNHELAVVRQDFEGQHDNLRSEHQLKVDDLQKRLEEQRHAQSGAVQEHRQKLLESERHNGVLEGRLQALDSEAQTLRERVREMEEKVREAEVAAERRREENGLVERELDAMQARASRHRSEAEWRASGGLTAQEEDEMEQLRSDAEEAERMSQPKGCGGSLRRLMRRRSRGSTLAAAGGA